MSATPNKMPIIVPNPIQSSENGRLNGTAQSIFYYAQSDPDYAQQVYEQSKPRDAHVGAGPPPLPPFFFFPLDSANYIRDASENIININISLVFIFL